MQKIPHSSLYMISALLIFLFITNLDLSFAQNNENIVDQDSSGIFYFGCSNLMDLFHCDPIQPNIESYYVNAKSSFVYLPREYGQAEEYGSPIVSMVFSDDGRLFFTEKETGNIRILKDDKVLATPFAHISDIHTDFEQGLLGINLDPDFQKNHFVYVYHTYNDTNTNTIYNKLVRFTEENNLGIDSKIILDQIPAGVLGMHSGGALAFGPEDKLYITVGDRYEPDTAQDLSELTGKILRINKDGSFPSDNPFDDSLVFTYGHRNMFGIAFDNHGKGIITENGLDFYDEVNLINKGANYGWPVQQLVNQPPEISHSSTKPIRSYWKTIVPTQAIFYDGNKFPELTGKFLFGTYNPQKIGINYNDWSSNIFSLDLSNDGKIIEYVISADHQGPVIGIAQSPEGDIYFGGWHISKLESIDISKKDRSLFPIEISGVDSVTDVQFIPIEKKLVMNVISSEKSPNAISVKIDEVLLNNIKLITDGENELEFDIRQTNGYSNIEIFPSSKGIFQINITGNLEPPTVTENLESPKITESDKITFPLIFGLITIILIVIIVLIIFFRKKRKLSEITNK